MSFKKAYQSNRMAVAASIPAYEHGLPRQCIAFVESIVALAEANTREGREVTPVAFIGSYTHDMPFAHVDLVGASSATHDQVRMLAASQRADYVLTVTEGWGLGDEHVVHVHQIISQYGSISASPFRKPCAHFRLETRNALWVANAWLSPVSATNNQHVLGPVEFRLADEASPMVELYLQSSISKQVH